MGFGGISVKARSGGGSLFCFQLSFLFLVSSFSLLLLFVWTRFSRTKVSSHAGESRISFGVIFYELFCNKGCCAA